MSSDPKSIANSHTELGGVLSHLVEELAASHHDFWARRRIAEGWRSGARRDDAEKETLALVPYDELPDDEKEYARETESQALCD